MFEVRPDEVVVGEDFSFSCRKDLLLKTGKHLASASTRDKSPQKSGRIVAGIHPISVNCGHSYPDPIPVAMQSVRILDLATVDINWKMLTVSRPANKLDEEYFTKYIH